MRTRTSAPFVLVLLLAWCETPALGQCGGHEWHKLLASDGADGDYFGSSVSMDGKRVIVGAWGAGLGAAYVYHRRGVFWDEFKLTASDGKFNAFGTSVALDGNLAVVGAYTDETLGRDAGAAYVFRYDGTGWSEEQKLLASDGAADDRFGSNVAVSGNVILVGAYLHDHGASDMGSAYVFRDQGGTWVEEQELTAGRDIASGDGFGRAVALDGDVALIGAPWDDDFGPSSGSAYRFRYEGGTWIKRQKLTASDPGDRDRFGDPISLDRDLALIGAYFDDDGGSNAGSAYLFRATGGVLAEEQKLTASDGAPEDQFGRSVSVLADQAIIGAYRNDDAGANTGSAYLFRFTGASWVEEQKLLGSDAAAGDYFGVSASLSGDLAVIGAHGDDVTGTDVGSAYLFRVTPLALDVEPELVKAGDRITLTTCGGLTGAPVMLALVEVNGIGLFHQLAIGAFNSAGIWSMSATVPPGLAGFELGFQSFGIIQPGKLGGSNREWVTFL